MTDEEKVVFIHKLWEAELYKALTVRPTPWPMDFTPKPLTPRERVRRLYRNLTDWWPLQWKERSLEED